jgi:hypothetical protein
VNAHGSVPPSLRRALRPTTARCGRHCGRRLRGRTVRPPAPGWLCVYACPGGSVATVVYTEWRTADPTATLHQFASGHTWPSTLVRRRDFRSAARHGPELGTEAERILGRAEPPRELYSVYWRVYPQRKRDGTVHRLFVCTRHGPDDPQFFLAPGDRESPPCPRCTPSRRRTAVPPRRAP